MVRDVAVLSINVMCPIRLFSRTVVQSASSFRRFLLHPPITDQHQFLGFVQYIDRFLRRIIRNLYRLLYFLGRIHKLYQKILNVFHEAKVNTLRKKEAR
ncbi:hypothetical protein TNCV_4134681 [Trichonephila clavipes]|nr:hypothetical protein TNCV_4134681 [Trichonephila clavipes]